MSSMIGPPGPVGDMPGFDSARDDAQKHIGEVFRLAVELRTSLGVGHLSNVADTITVEVSNISYFLHEMHWRYEALLTAFSGQVRRANNYSDSLDLVWSALWDKMTLDEQTTYRVLVGDGMTLADAATSAIKLEDS